MDLYQNSPIEEEVYIENFKVVSNQDQYLVTDHPYKLNFHPATVFMKTNVHIHVNDFSFVSIKAISEETESNLELIGSNLSNIDQFMATTFLVYLFSLAY